MRVPIGVPEGGAWGPVQGVGGGGVVEIKGKVAGGGEGGRWAVGWEQVKNRQVNAHSFVKTSL